MRSTRLLEMSEVTCDRAARVRLEVLHTNIFRNLRAAQGPQPNPKKTIMAIARGYVDVLDLDVALSDLAQASPWPHLFLRWDLDDWWTSTFSYVDP